MVGIGMALIGNAGAEVWSQERRGCRIRSRVASRGSRPRRENPDHEDEAARQRTNSSGSDANASRASRLDIVQWTVRPVWTSP